MSYDVAVWVGERPADDAAAAATYDELWARYEDAAVEPDPRILAYIADLTARYPDLDDLDDDHLDDSPWADSPLVDNVMGPFFYFSMTYPGADEALPFVAATAAAHGLVCFDPQDGTLI